AIDELDHCKRRIVAKAEASLHDAKVATVARRIARGKRVEQAANQLVITDGRDRLAAGVKIATLAKGYQLLHDRAKFLRLRKGGDDLLMLDERGRHIGEHGLTVARGSVQLAAGFSVTHGLAPNIAGVVPKLLEAVGNRQ